MSTQTGKWWRRSVRRLRRWFGWSLITLLIVVALCVALASQFLPLLARHPDKVADWLSRQIDAPVSLSALDAHWNRAGPELALTGLRIGHAPEVLDIDRARLQINVYSGLWPGTSLTELRLTGPELELRRSTDGRWRLDGFGHGPTTPAETSQLDQLDRFGTIDVVDARLRVHDARAGHQFELPRVNARLQRDRGRLKIGALLHARQGTPLRFAADLARDLKDGTAYLEGIGQDWAAWLQGLDASGMRITHARGDVRAWLDVVEGEVHSAQLAIGLDSVHVSSVDEIDDHNDMAQTSGFTLPAMNVSAQLANDGAGDWSLAVPRWRVTLANAEAGGAAGAELDLIRDGWFGWSTSGLLRAQVGQLDLLALSRLARVSPHLPSALTHWLTKARPHGELHRLEMIWSDADHFSFQAEVHDLGWDVSGGIPSITGISGRLDGDATAMRLHVLANHWTVLAPGVFRAPFRPQVDGEILVFRPDQGWRIDTPGLRFLEDDYDIQVAGGAESTPEGGVLLDLRADVGPAPIVVAKRFWPLNVMPEPVVAWLDTALRDGEVAHGAALIRGNVLDWPFRHGEGRFEAQAELAGATIRFDQDWPDGQAISGSARFINTAMEVDLQGRIQGASVRRARGGIADFGDAVLQLDIAGAGAGRELLGVLRHSPLQATYGTYLQGLELGGRGVVALNLHIPLEKGLGEPRADGHVDIERMDLDDATWGLGFKAASGRVRFSRDGFSADELNVGFGGSLAALSIAVGDYTSRPEHLVEASVRGRFSAAALAQSSERSAWLQPWFDGESDWNLQLTVPQDRPGVSTPPQLRVRSDLVGTAITLPAPLRKAAAERLPLDLRLGLPLESSELDVRLGRLLHLRGHLSDAAGFTGFAAFGDVPDPSIPARGLHVAGQIPVLDVAAWGSAIGQTSGASELYLVSADLFAGELNVLGRRFRETGISMQRDADQVTIGFSGEPLEGQLLVPVQGLLQKGVTGHFKRLYWPSADAGTADEAGEETASDDVNIVPSTIPPLHLESQDTRFADARLGSLWLETWPTREGLHVERLDTHSTAFNLKAKGDWNAGLAGERSELKLDYSAHDAGELLEALGFSRLIDGGATHGQLQLSWPGSPGAFDWSGADGRLDVNISQGRLLEVEPGAGRLFGLLSLAEIPRRLALDFSDFFKSGFAFNQMEGRFEIRKGDAFTEGFRIDAPSADIRLSGRTGLKARDYDQTLEVRPKAGSVLPAIGALAGGPAGAAVGAVAQAVLREPLRQMTQIGYRITGTWADPKVEPIERVPQNDAGAR